MTSVVFKGGAAQCDATMKDDLLPLVLRVLRVLRVECF
jgi:hypothetical protein